jgi:hypothetical protein
MPGSGQYEARRLIMTATPDDAGQGTGRFEVLDDDVADEDVDVLTLTGQCPPAGGAWLWVTAAGGRPGGEFTALFLPRNRPQASGGDVLLRLGPGTDEPGEPRPIVRVQVHAVAGGKLALVAGWDRLDLDGWPEAVRATVAFAMGALAELEAHGADTGAREQVDVEAAARSAMAGFPALPSRTRAGAGG